MRYIFAARSRPETAIVRFEVRNPPLRLKIAGIENQECEVSLLLSGGLFSAVAVVTQQPINDIATFRNQIATICRSIYDAATFMQGQAVGIEIVSLTEVDTGRFWTFLDKVPQLSDSASQRPLSTEAFFNLAISNVRLRSALGDLKDAITSPNDTGFYCYRAIETLMQDFKQVGETESKKAWERFREALRITQDWIKPLTDSSVSNRHGELKPISGSERILLMQRSWEITYRFVCLRLRDAAVLPEAEFPMLQ
jgi:hypothetical protein